MPPTSREEATISWPSRRITHLEVVEPISIPKVYIAVSFTGIEIK
jgi:hypothetical protein